MGDPMQTASAAEQLFSVGGFSKPEHISSGAPELFKRNWHSTMRTDTPFYANQKSSVIFHFINMF